MLPKRQKEKFFLRKFIPKVLALLVSLLPIPMLAIKGVGQQLEAATSEVAGSRLTIQQAIEEAIQNNLNLLAEQLNLSIAEARLITASLKPNPVFSFSSDHLDLAGTGFNEINGGGPAEISWRVDVPIERGGKRDLRIATANYEREIAGARLVDSLRKLKLEVTLAGIEVIAAKASLVLTRESLRTFEELVQTNTARANAGSIAPLELTRSQVAMLQFRRNVKQAELALLTAKTKLQNLLGRKTLADDFDLLDELKVPLLPVEPQLIPLQEVALENRPDLHVLQLTQARSQSELRLEVAQGKVDYTWGTEYRRQQGINGKSNSLGFFFSVPLPFYNRNQGEIARVRAEQEQLARQMQALKSQVQTEVKTAYEAFRSARELVESIERDLLKPAQQARDTSAYVYRSSASSLIEFLDAQRAFNETMQSYQEAQAFYRRALVQLNATVSKEVIQ